MRSIVVRTLSSELRLHTDDPLAFSALSYLGADPVMPGGDPPPVDLEVERAGDGYRVALPDRPPIEGSLDALLNGLSRHLIAGLIEDAGDAPILHAATATIDGRRFAFIGDKGAGKTTLMLKLIEEGFAVEGDEHLVVTAEGAIVRPRRLHVKERSLHVVTSLADAVRASPWATDPNGQRVFACAPSLGGGSWEIVHRPIEHLIFMEPNFGGKSSLSSIEKEETFSRLVRDALLPKAVPAAAVGRLRMLSDAKSSRLLSGELGEAVSLLRNEAAKC